MNNISKTIGWADYSWNPITGCLNDCFYCYAKAMFKRFGKSFEPQFHPERLDEPFRAKKPSRIFVGSVTDMFADWSNKEWTEQVIQITTQCPQHTFLFLTKSPNNYVKYDFPDNCWCGATFTGDHNSRIEKINYPIIRIKRDLKLFWSYEPIMSIKEDGWLCYSLNPHRWIIIGAMSGQYAKHYPVQKETIKYFIEETRKYSVPLFMKSNLKPYWSEPLIQEFPQ